MNRYEFRTVWVVSATPQEVSSIIQDPLDLPRWWPSVYLRVEPDGEEFCMLTQALLPYRLRWRFSVSESNPPFGFSLQARGDLEGWGKWTLQALDDCSTRVTFDWVVLANKPLLKFFTPLLRPLFSANHAWAMARGLESLQLELRRRRGLAQSPPPGPVQWWPVAVAGLVLAWFWRALK